MIFIQLNFVQSDYRTHVHMGSDYWVAYLSIYERFLKPCKDLVKTVNVVNVVKTLLMKTASET